MSFFSKAFYLCVCSILTTVVPRASYADEALEGGYTPSEREVCEMNASNLGSRELETCSDVKVFEPLVKSDISEVGQKVGVTKEEFPEWPFPDVYFQYKLDNINKVVPTFNIGTDEPHFVLELEPDHTLVSVSIGHIDDVLILELKQNLGGSHVWHKQIIYTPYSCEGYDGYGDEVYYYAKSSIGWSQAFAGEIFEKAFFSQTLCN